MINNKKILALITARSGSKGLPGKNIKELCGKPLLGWPITAARGSKYVDKVVISTDSQQYADIAVQLGAEAPFLRPSKLASDTASSFDVVKHVVDFFKNTGKTFDYLVLLEPTSPLTEPIDIDLALERLEKRQSIADSIIGVSKLESAHPCFNVTVDKKSRITPWYTDDFSSAGRRQDLDNIYFFEGTLYISKMEALLKHKGFYHERTLAYKVPKWKSFEVDDITDFYCIESIMKNLQKIKEYK